MDDSQFWLHLVRDDDDLGYIKIWRGRKRKRNPLLVSPLIEMYGES
jgi:hypothetical protein